MALIAVSVSVSAQATGEAESAARSTVVHIKGLRFTDGLLNKWVSEYGKQHPDLLPVVAGTEGNAHSIEVAPASVRATDAAAARATVVSFSRYAVLPFAGRGNALLEALNKKKLNEKRLKELFFEGDALDDDFDPDKKDRYDAVIYSGNGSRSAAHSFAGHFGYEAGRLKGKKVAGDDIYLNSAVRKDAKGVSFNPLNYVFDLESRQLNEGIGLLPLDVKKEYTAHLQNLDETITLLESKEIDLVPVDELAFVLPEKVSAEMLRFVAWALSDGQQYVHAFGFLQLDEKALDRQKRQLERLETNYLAEK
jgi:ABC-type phosphate transport system substrate-binding protein